MIVSLKKKKTSMRRKATHKNELKETLYQRCTGDKNT
jgi:hypothetical protein